MYAASSTKKLLTNTLLEFGDAIYEKRMNNLQLTTFTMTQSDALNKKLPQSID